MSEKLLKTGHPDGVRLKAYTGEGLPEGLLVTREELDNASEGAKWSTERDGTVYERVTLVKKGAALEITRETQNHDAPEGEQYTVETGLILLVNQHEYNFG